MYVSDPRTLSNDLHEWRHEKHLCDDAWFLFFHRLLMLEYKFWDLLMGKPESYPAGGLRQAPEEKPIRYERSADNV